MMEGIRNSDRYRAAIPQIARLVEAGGGVEEIYQQIEQDNGVSSNDGLERVYLGLQALVSRGKEGEPVLERLEKAHVRTALGEAAALLLRGTSFSPRALESTLRIERGFKTSSEAGPDFVAKCYSHALKKGYTRDGPEDFIRKLEKAFANDGPPEQLAETIEGHLMSPAATFGSSEPTYLELLGPNETLRIRALERPRFLLLGSYGKYSAQEFDIYSRKVNPSAEACVIDIDPVSVGLIRKSNEHIPLVRGDARMLPYADETMEQVCTNHLFHFLETGWLKDLRFRGSIDKLLRESFRVLKPGGSLLLVEQGYGKYVRPEDTSRMKDEIRSLAAEAGFYVKRETHNINYALVPEQMKAYVDANGFAHYSDALLIEEDHAYCGRLVKRS